MDQSAQPGGPLSWELFQEQYRRVRQRRHLCYPTRSDAHTSELKSLMRISYAVFPSKKKPIHTTILPTRAITATGVRVEQVLTPITYNNLVTSCLAQTTSSAI